MAEAALDRTGRAGTGPAWLEGMAAWLEGRKAVLLAAAACLQVIVLLAMIALRALPLFTGEPLLVRVVPVDPRDLFRGDYVVLGYAFSRLPATGIEGVARAPGAGRRHGWEGRTVYVSLAPEPDGIHWRAETFALRPPVAGKYIRGRIVGHDLLEFGIEAYYVQEGTGRDYERAAREKRLSAEIALTSGGQAALRALRIE
jgi:uncharacterized membrane-anchored protein